MKNKKILNLGCGEDTHGTHFVDIHPTRDDVLKCDIDNEKLSFKNNYFDEVYSTFLFEHLTNPNLAIKEIWRVLKPNGKVKIITDNAGFWGWHTPISKDNYGARWNDDRHYALYTPDHLKSHLEKVGFKNIRTKYILVKRRTPYWYVRFISHLMYRIPIFKRIAYNHILVTAKK